MIVKPSRFQVLNGLMNNRLVEPRLGFPLMCCCNPAFHAGLLSFNPFGIRGILISRHFELGCDPEAKKRDTNLIVSL